MIAGAEAAVVKTKGVAESKVIAVDADIKKAEAHAIRLGAAGKKRLDDAEASKIEAEAMLLQFDLKQKQVAAGLRTGTKKPETEEEKERRCFDSSDAIIMSLVQENKVEETVLEAVPQLAIQLLNCNVVSAMPVPQPVLSMTQKHQVLLSALVLEPPVSFGIHTQLLSSVLSQFRLVEAL
jgi:hypothetical protein